MGFTIARLGAIALLALTASAVPAAPTCKTTQQQANFDELPNNSVLPGPEIPVGYQGLYWQSFIVANTDDVGIPLASLQPKSPIK
ncbi:hypothetical protein PRZ48_007554 [Zasmidium cellare]|uniref:Uncharacterized protein n=1 Tax=Zasmidium cellare TaxID=395010 RepID=A0ABR0EKG1_ZASCE|nr:hypothetical protein PRZ48_007554 [Zasmidium cellare]